MENVNWNTIRYLEALRGIGIPQLKCIATGAWSRAGASRLVKGPTFRQWLLDSTPYIAIRPQGLDDNAPVFPIVTEFLPYEKLIPLLDNISNRVESPITAMLMCWEHVEDRGFIPIAFLLSVGIESMKKFTEMAQE